MYHGRSMVGRRLLQRLALLIAVPCLAQTGKIDRGARKEIDAGNQAWVNGMKQGAPALTAATYADDALDCATSGECARGRGAIEERMKDRLARLGRAVSASVTSLGSAQQGDFVYEWGRAEATFGNGQRLAGRYLTVWQKQAGGGWKIFRNLALPDDGRP